MRRLRLVVFAWLAAVVRLRLLLLRRVLHALRLWRPWPRRQWAPARPVVSVVSVRLAEPEAVAAHRAVHAAQMREAAEAAAMRRRLR